MRQPRARAESRLLKMNKSRSWSMKKTIFASRCGDPACGLQREEAWEEINAIDDKLEQKLDFAFNPRFGYLTACPTNVGTGIRVSVMLHLPALKLTGEIEKVFRAAKDLKLAVRGLYGE